MRRTTARHQINVIPIGTIKSPLHNLPPLPAGNKQGRLVLSLVTASCPEAEARGDTDCPEPQAAAFKHGSPDSSENALPASLPSQRLLNATTPGLREIGLSNVGRGKKKTFVRADLQAHKIYLEEVSG